MVTQPTPIPIPPNADPAAAGDLWVYQDPKGRFWDAFNATWTTNLPSATVYAGNYEHGNDQADPPTAPPRGHSYADDHHWRRLTSLFP